MKIRRRPAVDPQAKNALHQAIDGITDDLTDGDDARWLHLNVEWNEEET